MLQQRNVQILGLVIGAAVVVGPDGVVESAHARSSDREITELLELLDDFFSDAALIEAVGDDDDDGDDEDELELDDVAFFIELNDTDGDIGVQCSLGGEPYRQLKAYGPNGRKILDIRPRRSLRRQGMSDISFESGEPTFDKVGIEDFLDRFPEGEYEFETRTLDGAEQDGETEFTHDIPAAAVITAPAEGAVVSENNLVIQWEPVTMTTELLPPQRPVNIKGYQIILTREDPLREFSAFVPPDVTSITAPSEFLEAETEYELEILAIEESDNQTISLIFFETE